MSELKPCLCGSKDVGGARGVISCYLCGFESKVYTSTEDAAEAWNNRPRLHTPAREMLELLRTVANEDFSRSRVRKQAKLLINK